MNTRSIGSRGRGVWGVAIVASLAASVVVAGCNGTYNSNGVGYPAVQLTPAAASVPATATPSVKPTPAATPTPIPAPAVPAIATVTVTSAAADGRWTVSFKKPVVSGIPAAAAGAINASITKAVNAYIASFTTGLPAVASGDGPSTLEGSFTVAMDSTTLLSIRFTVLQYATGAAHPEGIAGAASFVVASGASISLSDLFTSDAAALPVLSAQAKALLTAQLGTDYSWPASPTMSSFGAFDLTAAGLELTWSQGSITAEAAGDPTIVVPWSTLSAVIKASGPAAEFLP